MSRMHAWLHIHVHKQSLVDVDFLSVFIYLHLVCLFLLCSLFNGLFVMCSTLPN